VTDDPVLLDLVSQYCGRTTVRDGHYQAHTRGIALGSPLSPLMGALYLAPLDAAMEALPGVACLRLMDDWLILAESRWKLRRAVKIMNQVLQSLGLEQHPDKTFIGRVERGFDFLGFDFSPSGLTGSSTRSLARHIEKTARLYEQGASPERIGRYREQRWPMVPACSAPDPCRAVGQSFAVRTGRLRPRTRTASLFKAWPSGGAGTGAGESVCGASARV
jgi:hypothetical protein